MLDSDLWYYRHIEIFILDDFTKSKVSRLLIFSASETGNFWHYWFHCPVCQALSSECYLFTLLFYSQKSHARSMLCCPFSVWWYWSAKRRSVFFAYFSAEVVCLEVIIPYLPRPQKKCGDTDPLILQKKLGRKWIIRKFVIPEVYNLWKENHLTSLCFGFFHL